MTGIGIIGIGGFAKSHLQSIKNCNELNMCTLEAAAIRSTEKYKDDVIELKKVWPDLRVYKTAEEMIEAEKENIQLVAIPTGIPSHRYYSALCLEKGFHVMCEKPVAGTIEDALAMKAAQEKTGKILAIGFQNIFSPSVQRIKEIRTEGSLGKLISIKTWARWKRTSVYYNRNSWAGCLKDEDHFVFDSPIQNATAHYLQNMLYVAGTGRHETALPVKIYGENYHAQNIESADTQYIRCTTKEGVKLSFAVTHATKEHDGPHAEFIFEKGHISWTMKEGKTRVFNDSGKEIETLTNGKKPIHRLVFEDTLRAMKENRNPLSHIGNAYQHTVCINYLYRTNNGVNEIEEKYKTHSKVENEAYGQDLVITDKDRNTAIIGIDEDMTNMFNRGGISYFEQGIPWAKKGKELDVSID